MPASRVMFPKQSTVRRIGLRIRHLAFTLPSQSPNEIGRSHDLLLFDGE
jgi:hypothetical protein